MSVNSELMRLVVKMGGTVSEEDTNSELLAKIVDLWDGGSEENQDPSHPNIS